MIVMMMMMMMMMIEDLRGYYYDGAPQTQDPILHPTTSTDC